MKAERTQQMEWKFKVIDKDYAEFLRLKEKKQRKALST